MTKNNYYENQSEITAAKIQLYSKYIEGYLPKLLMQFGTCLIADLFYGAGKNGTENGSPLVLINRAKYILSSSNFHNKTIQILFNDQNEAHIKNLKNELEKVEIEKNIKIKGILNEKFENLLPQIIKKYKNSNIPKFFFLDPFSYSNVQIEDLKQLIGLPRTELLLFIPLFHSYRFANVTGMSQNHKTRMFIEKFTTKGMCDYSGIYDFMESSREKLLEELSLDFVRPVLLDAGASKNTLFLLTKHREGMLLMNEVAIKMSGDMDRVKVKNINQPSLFRKEDISQKYKELQKKIINQLMQGNLTNDEIALIAIKEGLLPKHSKEIIEELYRQNKLKVYNELEEEIKSRKKWNIAKKITKIVYFK